MYQTYTEDNICLCSKFRLEILLTRTLIRLLRDCYTALPKSLLVKELVYRRDQTVDIKYFKVLLLLYLSGKCLMRGLQIGIRSMEVL